MHLPFIYDAYHRHFLPEFVNQYANVANLILTPIFPRPGQKSAENEGQPGAGSVSASPAVGEPSHAQPIAKSANSPSATVVPGNIFEITDNRKAASGLSHLCSSTSDLRHADYRALPLRCPNEWPSIAGCYFSALLAGSFTSFPQFFLIRPDLPHLIEFMKAGLIALTCAVWLLWSSQGKGPVSIPFAVASQSSVSLIFYSRFPNPYGGTLALRTNRHTEFRGANGVDVILNRMESEEVNTLFSATVLNSTKKDYVVCYPYLPGVNFITARPTFQTNSSINNMVQSPDWQRIEIAKIQQHRPAVIIIDDWKIDGTEESRFSHWATADDEIHRKPLQACRHHQKQKDLCALDSLHVRPVLFFVIVLVVFVLATCYKETHGEFFLPGAGS